MPSVYVGTKVRLTASFTDESGTKYDPTTVTLKVKFTESRGVVTYSTNTYTYPPAGTIVKDSTGEYHADLDTTAQGLLIAQWKGSGPSEPTTFNEDRLTILPLTEF